MDATGERWRGTLAGFVAGLAGGLFGVGGGILLVPLLTGWFACTQHQAHGTSLAAIGATAIAGLAVYAAHGQVAWVTGAIMAVTSMLCARLGARLAARTSRAALARAPQRARGRDRRAGGRGGERSDRTLAGDCGYA